MLGSHYYLYMYDTVMFMSSSFGRQKGQLATIGARFKIGSRSRIGARMRMGALIGIWALIKVILLK